jgi:hypothetical protein
VTCGASDLLGKGNVPNGEVAARVVGDQSGVADPIEISRRIRRRIDRDGLSADIAADVNVVVSTGGGTARARQDAPIRQTRSAGAGRPRPADASADEKEQP